MASRLTNRQNPRATLYRVEECSTSHIRQRASRAPATRARDGAADVEALGATEKIE